MNLKKKGGKSVLEKLFQTLNVVQIVVQIQNHILMGRKKYGPDKDKIVLPGGKVKENEFFYIASARELFEETSLIAKSMTLQHAGHMIENCLSIKFQIFFVDLTKCMGEISESEELCDLNFYHINYLPLDCVYQELVCIHQDLFDGNKYYFEIYKGNSNSKISYKKQPLLINNVVYRKEYPKKT